MVGLQKKTEYADLEECVFFSEGYNYLYIRIVRENIAKYYLNPERTPYEGDIEI